MKNNENIICISSIDWDFIWQGHQEIMAAFAKNGNRVLFIENTGVRVPGIRDTVRLKKRLVNWLRGIKGFREVSENLYVYSPLVLPFPYSRATRWINKNFLFASLKKWAKVMNFRDAIVWTFLPTGTALDIIDEFDCKCLVYYCIADFYKLANTERVQKTENTLIKKADVIFVQGKSLEEKCRKFNANVYIFPFGVNINIFDASRSTLDKSDYKDIGRIKKPIIGYIGGIHRHIDFELLKHIAKSNPNWSLVLIGPIQVDISSLKEIPNIVFLGQKDFHLLPGYIKEFDVCIIPYLKSEYTDTVYPTKLNEYHMLGKSVVATALPEIVAFNQENENLVLLAETKEEFIKQIKNALEEKDSNLVNLRIESAKRHSWDIRIEEMGNLIEEVIQKKKIIGYPDWQKRFKHIYRVARRRFVKVAFVFAVLWLLIFYTPLIWYAARPLKIVSKLQQADAIVVFGGGVGEGGSPGKSTIERARYAAELYKDEYADYVIFSSGYVYKYNDAENMKLIALSAGVPERKIILEQKANSTYENAKFTKEILDTYNWNTILLVSSPYNMRRASLAFKKLDKNLKIIYTPVIEPQFYYRDRKVKWKQIRAIAHEYLGIVYYWWKGYI